ncbi:MAG TPA: riboflavin synthase [Acidimicrobiales bacterium]|nr:riboflavin synthase [Acidimicrobiales bacterium]
MFTGIVEELARVRSRNGGRFTFYATTVMDGLHIGDSIAHNGCCLTVVETGADTGNGALQTLPYTEPPERSGGKIRRYSTVSATKEASPDAQEGGPPDGAHTWYAADVVEETLARTNLGDLTPGDPVNLERPLKASDRLNGHLVQGHVDAVGHIVSAAPALEIRMPPDLARYVVEKGSIAVDGVSLTVAKALPDGFTAVVVPHTAAVTTLGFKGPDDAVNIEVDLVAKYVERLLIGTTEP